MRSWEMPSKNIFFAYSALIISTLKGSTVDSETSVAKVKNLQGVIDWTRMALIFPYGQKSMPTKRADIHLT